MFLEHAILVTGIFVDLRKVKAVLKWEKLVSVIKIHSLLDLAGYYRRFIYGFSTITSPLTWITHKKKVKFEWLKEYEGCFQELKRRLTSFLKLTLSLGTEGLVYNDAIRKGLGCVFMQNGRIISYASKLLKPHEVNYLVYDLGLAMVVFALQVWRHYLYGS